MSLSALPPARLRSTGFAIGSLVTLDVGSLVALDVGSRVMLDVGSLVALDRGLAGAHDSARDAGSRLGMRERAFVRGAHGDTNGRYGGAGSVRRPFLRYAALFA